MGAREAYVNLEALELELRAAQERIAALQSHGEHSGESAQDRAIAALEELQGTLEELQVAQEEMRQQNEALVEVRLQEALARDRYQDLFESAPDAYLVTDLAGAIQEANHAAGRLFQRNPKHLAHKPLTVFVDEESLRDFRTNLLKLSRGEAVPAWEIRLRMRQGAPVDTEVLVTTVKGRAARPVALRWLLRDITARKRAEEQVKALNAELEERVRKRTAALESALAAQRESEAEIEALNARLLRAMQETHHRVKNNLQIIASMVDMQLMDHPETVPAGDLRRLGDYARALAAVHDILTYEHRHEEPVATLSARAVLEKLLPLMQQTAGARHIRYHLEEAQFPVSRCTSLALIVNELVNNAIKHGEGEVEVTLGVEGKQASLEVCDHGPGLPEGFDPELVTSTGLELVTNLTHTDLGGKIVFSARPEGGTKVTVTLPLGVGR